MIKSPWIVALLVLVTAGLGAGAWFGLRKSAGPAPQPLTVSFTADVRGRLVPCGCFSGQMGGLTRIATILCTEPAGRSLTVDVGDALEGTEDFQRIQYRYILEAFSRMGYDAANLGHREAALSAAQLREIKGRSPVPLLSANLLDKTTGAPLLDTHRIVRRGAWKIALVGGMDEKIAPESLGEGLAVEPLDTALARLLPSLKKEADFIVLLAFVDEAALARLARNFYELDLVLGGKVSQPSQQLVRENRSLLLYTTNQSRALGRLEMTLSAPARMQVHSGEVMLVHDKIAEDRSIRALADQYREEIRHTRLAIDDPATLQADRVPGVRNAATFAGTESCLPCHGDAAHKWQATGHARAFSALVAVKADADPNCIGCHSVGFGAPGGYRREFAGQKLVNVGCESCHGPGSQHVAQHQQAAGTGSGPIAKLRSLGAGDCQKCHHGEFSRPFSWDTFWPHVAHDKVTR